jgi:hypothetical protein
MRTTVEDLVLIPYGVAAWTPDQVALAGLSLRGLSLDSGAPLAVCRHGVPLRLSSDDWPFAEPPDLVRMPETADRLVFLCEHLKSLCGLWDKGPRLFLDIYFRHILRCIAAEPEALTAASARHGALFRPLDWSFSALRPLPAAHIVVEDEEAVRADFAFWSGDGVVAVDIAGLGSSKARREARERLRRHGVAVIEIALDELQRDGENRLASRLPPVFQTFWDGVALPASPFKAAALSRIQVDLQLPAQRG